MKNKKIFAGISLVIAVAVVFSLTACVSMTIVNVEWDTLQGPQKIRQFLGISISEVRAFVVYKNGDRRQTNAWTLRYDKDTVGPQSVIVSIGSIAGGSFQTEVMELIDIRVERLPTKTSYTEGEQAALSGIRVMGKWEGMPDAEIPVSQLRVADFDSSAEGGTDITVSYNGMNASFPVTVTARAVAPASVPASGTSNEVSSGTPAPASAPASGTNSETSSTTQIIPAGNELDLEGNDYIEINDNELEIILSSAVKNPAAVVGPLITTNWTQSSPYNDLFPIVGGKRLLTDCGNNAMAQILRFHKNLEKINGKSTSVRINSDTITVPTVNFNNVDYDWDNILDSYTSANPGNARQRNAAATLVYHFAAAVGASMDAGAGAYPRNYMAALTNILGYDKSIELHYRGDYSDNDWAAMIRQQLDLGLPVYYWGKRDGGNHAFVVDGYDKNGRFHINWGWGGKDNGWYAINNLNPPSRSHYKYSNLILINIKPDEGGVPAGYEMSLRNFSFDKTTVSQNELFTVTMQIRNLSSFGVFSGGQQGVALVNNSGKIVTVVGNNNRAALNQLSTAGTATINCYVPETITPGQYRLMAVIRETDKEWKVITKSGDGIPNAFPVTITAGLTNSGGYGLALTAFSANKTTVSQNEMFTVTMTPRNVGLEQFPGGQVGAALVDNNGRIAEVVGIRNRSALNAGSLSGVLEFNCYVPETVRTGQYRLMAVVRPEGGQWRIATLAMADIPTTINFTVTAGLTNSGGYGLALTAFSANKTTVSQNEMFTVTMTPRNVGLEQFPGGQVGAALVDNNGRIAEVIGTRNRSALNAGSLSGALEFNCTVPNTVRAGQYRLMAVVRPSGGEWRIATLALPNISNSINITVR